MMYRSIHCVCILRSITYASSGTVVGLGSELLVSVASLVHDIAEQTRDAGDIHSQHDKRRVGTPLGSGCGNHQAGLALLR